MEDKNYGMIEEIEKEIKQKYPLCDIEWFFDRNNFQNKKDEGIEIKRILNGLIFSICSWKNTIHFYIRIHKYKEWYILRILIEEQMPSELIDLLNKQMINKRNIISIMNDDRCTVVKMILYCNYFNKAEQ